MAVFNEPTQWAQTLGKDADVVSIPDTAGETEPSIDKIFPSVFSIPLANGGRAIPRSVLNGLFKLLGDWAYYFQNGGVATYNNTFDYVVGSFVKYNNEFYRCIQANGASTTVKAPTETAYWSKITTLADVANAFANQDLSNLSALGLDKFANPSLSNINNTAKIAIAHNAMPSIKYDDLTLGASGSGNIYTAPADGYVALILQAYSPSHWATIVSSNNIVSRAYATSLTSGSNPQGLVVWLPIVKNGTFYITYSSGMTSNFFRFVYAIGSESEQ